MIPQIKKTTNRVMDFFLDLLFPRFCFSCGRENTYLCADCKDNLRGYHHPFCPICKNKIVFSQKCPRKCKSHIKLALSPFSYDAPLIKDLIHNFKYNFIKSLGVDLADFMIESFKHSNLLNRYAAVPLSSFLIVPVPLHRRRLAWRGFNQSEILARQISEKLNMEFQGLLKRTKNTKPQIEMASAEERQENIKDAFTIKTKQSLSLRGTKPARPNGHSGRQSHDLENKTIILIDDMLTTGATLEECARILKQNGAREIWALTAAR